MISDLYRRSWTREASLDFVQWDVWNVDGVRAGGIRATFDFLNDGMNARVIIARRLRKLWRERNKQEHRL